MATNETPTPTLPACWQDLDDCLRSGIDRVILFGPAGIGKTYGGMTLGDTDGGAYRLVCTEDMTNLDVTGGFMPSSDKGFMWLDGAALKAWKGNGNKGGRLIVDEVDKAGGDVFATLLAMLDSPESASYEHPMTGEVIRPLAGFSAVMTTNIENMGELPTALADRFPVRIRINEPHPDALLRLSPNLRGYAVRMADAGDERISLRAFMALDKLSQSLGMERACLLTFGEMRGRQVLDALRVDALSPEGDAHAVRF